MAALLLSWWLIAPAFYDDGWTIARQFAFTTTGSFSNYYESFGVALPLGYWLEWLQHWITRSTDALVVMRLPTLLCLAGIWLICRWIFSQIHGPLRTWISPAHWALGVAFAAMVMAWGMSLRQEPAVALLVTGVVACTVRFVQTRSSSAITLAAVLVPLALTAHPTGIVVIAPLIAIAHECATWARARPAVAVTVLTASGALALALAFLGSDVEQRALDAQTLGTFSTTIVDWRDELNRYSVLTGQTADYVGYAAPLRRGAVALILLASLAYLLRRSRERRALLDLPARTLLIALLLFVATPSKWPWHFGALVGIVALAVAAETVRWRDARPLSSTLTRSVAALFGLVLVALWSWSPRGAWNAADLQTLDWTPRFERLVPLGTLAALLPLLLVAVGLLTRRLRKGQFADVPARVVSWAAPVLVIPLLIFTVAVLVADAVRTTDWTAARQNVAAVKGLDDCGLAEDLRVPALDSIRPLRTPDAPDRAPRPNWIPNAPVSGLQRFALGPALDSTAVTPWFTLGAGRDLGVFVSGRPGPADRVELQWGKSRAGRLVVIRGDGLPARPTATEEASMPWRLITNADLRPRRPRGATMVRLALENDASPAGALAVTGPFSYVDEPLARRISTLGTSTLALPHVATFFPCITLPRLKHGVVEPPGLIITTRTADPLLLDPGTSPFKGLLDSYDLQRLPIGVSSRSFDRTSPNWPSAFTVYSIDPRVRGWEKLHPART